MVLTEIISDCINKNRKYGNAITVVPCAEAMMQKEASITNSVASCTLMIEMVEQVNFSSGSMRAYYELQLVQDDLSVLNDIAQKQNMIYSALSTII
ncbi:MAG: hypothetical protein K2J39_09125 [Ruminococcus sp.]|nr:hypothetical protein [Ruminococcus sp.]